MPALSGTDGANEPAIIADTDAHVHANHDGWTALTADNITSSPINAALAQKKGEDGKYHTPTGVFRFYLQEDIEPSQTLAAVSVGNEQTVVVCMNGHSLTGYT